MRKIIAILLCGIMFAGCTHSMPVSADESAEKENITASPLPSPEQHQLYTWGDLDGDALKDKAEIIWEGDFALPFDVKVTFGSGETASITIPDETVDVGARIYISDVTNDGKTEIVLPNIGGTDTLGTVSCLLIGYDGEKLVREDVFGDGFFNRTSSTYTVEMDEKYGFTARSVPTGSEIFLYQMRFPYQKPGKELFFTSYTSDADIKESESGENGINVITSLEYGVYDESGENIIKAPLSKIHSTIMYDNGQWKVVKEFAEVPLGLPSGDPPAEPEEPRVKLDKKADPLRIFEGLDKYKNNLTAFIRENKNTFYIDGETGDIIQRQLKYKPIPDTYQIHNTYIGGYDARTIIKTEKEKVSQVYTGSLRMREKDNVYEQVRQVLGEPDVIYGYDEIWEFVEVEEYIPWPGHCVPVWDMGDYIIEMRSYPDGNMDPWWYIAAYDGNRSELSASSYENGFCCPHEYDMVFDENCIFFMDGLIGSPRDEVIAKYNAQPAYSAYYSGEYYGEHHLDEYILEDVKVMGCDADLTVRHYPCYEYDRAHRERMEVNYVLDVTDKSAEEIQTICEEFCSQLTAALDEVRAEYIVDENHPYGIDGEEIKAVFQTGSLYEDDSRSEDWPVELYSWYIKEDSTSVRYQIRGIRSEESPGAPHEKQASLYMGCDICIDK